MQFPVLDVVEVLYKQHLALANGVLDTAISLFGIYFSFVLMPAMDVVLGTDLRPKAKVSKVKRGCHQATQVQAHNRLEVAYCMTESWCSMWL